MLNTSIKTDFPTLAANPDLIYLDSAASNQTPTSVLEAMNDYYCRFRSNVHRGLYTISEQAETAYEQARKKIADFINAKPSEIIFTKSATDALNLAALGWAHHHMRNGQEIILTMLEHHSNIVPWQMLAKRKGLKIRFWDIAKDGSLDERQLNKLLNKNTGLLCIAHVSNALGTINPLKKIIQKAYAANVKVVVDGAQSIAHLGANMEHLGGPDFYAFSGHKMFGPTGIGVLYGKEQLLEQMEPVFGGGNMIREVTQTHATWNDIPWKFEAGTPPIAEVIGLGAAVDYIRNIGLHNIRAHEQELVAYALTQLKKLPFVTLYGPCDPEKQSAIISFNINGVLARRSARHEGVHSHDVGAILNEDSIAVRAGHHCCMPLMERLGVPGTVRASFSIYNTQDDIDMFIRSLQKVYMLFNNHDPPRRVASSCLSTAKT